MKITVTCFTEKEFLNLIDNIRYMRYTILINDILSEDPFKAIVVYKT